MNADDSLSLDDSRPARGLRRGFTAVEFITVITIAFLLISLVVPAVRKAQSAARVTQCRNNLKQVMLGIHNYYQAHERYPPGYISIMGVQGSTLANEFGWAAFLLPYIDQSSLFLQIDFNTGIHFSPFPGIPADRQVINTPNSALAATQLPTLLCPDDPEPSIGNQSTRIGTAPGFAHSSYSAITGIHWMDLPCATISKRAARDETQLTAAPCIPSDGAFFLNSSTRLEDIRDGLSQTAVLGETSRRFDFRRQPASAMGNSTESAGGTHWAGVEHPVWQDQVLTATIEGINQPDQEGFSPGLNSAHREGVSVAFGDGSVRLLSPQIDSSTAAPYGVLQRLSTIRSADLTVEF